MLIVMNFGITFSSFLSITVSRSRTFKPVPAGSAALLSWIRPRGFWAFLSAI